VATRLYALDMTASRAPARFLLGQFLGRNAPAIDVVDVGAMQVPGVQPFYEPLYKSGVARVVGFEPIEAECAKLNAAARRNHTYLPYFIGDGREGTFYLTNTGYTSSLYEPNGPLVSRFNMLAEVMQVVRTSTVQTRKLDDVAEVANIDFLKADVQGSELDLLRGATGKLSTAVVVEVEVEFVALYKNQPLFAEVDQHMRAMGFSFHSFTGLAGRAFKPLTINNDPHGMLRQVLWSDAIYVRDFMRLSELTADQLLKLAVILHDVYESSDLAALALQHYEAKGGKEIWKFFVQKLTGGVPVERPPLE